MAEGILISERHGMVLASMIARRGHLDAPTYETAVPTSLTASFRRWLYEAAAIFEKEG